MGLPANPRTPTGVPLTPHQLLVAALVAHGMSNVQIAVELDVATMTVKSHIGAALRRAGALNRAHLVAILIRSGQLVWRGDVLVPPSAHEGRAA